MSEPGPFTRRRIAAIVEDALRAAGARAGAPVPLERVRAVAGVAAVRPMPELPAGLAAPAGPLLGALLFAERTIYVEAGQSAARRRFTEAHELMHALLPWHEAALRADTAAELFGPARARVEAEANLGASLLLLGGRAFAELAAAQPPSMRAALELAARCGASRHATLHRYAQVHPAPVALLLVGRFPDRAGRRPVWRSVESPAFGGSAAALVDAVAPGDALHELIEAARTSREPVTGAVALGGRAYAADVYDNRHALLVLLHAPAPLRRAA